MEGQRHNYPHRSHCVHGWPGPMWSSRISTASKLLAFRVCQAGSELLNDGRVARGDPLRAAANGYPAHQ